MKFPFGRSVFLAATLLLAGLGAESSNAQSRNSKLIGFKKVKDTFNECRTDSKNEYRGAGFVVNRTTRDAVEVIVAIETTRRFYRYPSIREVEITVQPLKRITAKDGKRSFVASGQPTSIVTRGLEFEKGESEMIITPKITMPIDESAKAVSVKIRGVFGRRKVTTLTANIDGENSAGVCYGKRKKK